MTTFDLLLQQTINGLSLGAMYSLLALGFTLVYGILELINFSHFNVFMVGSFIALFVLQWFGVRSGGDPHGPASRRRPTGGISGHHGVLGSAWRGDRATVPASPAQREGAGGDDHDDRRILYTVQCDPADGRRQLYNFPNPLPSIRWQIGGAVLDFRVVLIWAIALLLMGALYMFVQRSRIGKAMRATAQDAEAARMMGVEVDKVIIMAFFLGSALAGAGGLIFGLYYNFTSFIIGFTAGLRAFTAAVLGGIGNVPGAMVGGVLIGLIEAMGGQFIATLDRRHHLSRSWCWCWCSSPPACSGASRRTSPEKAASHERHHRCPVAVLTRPFARIPEIRAVRGIILLVIAAFTFPLYTATTPTSTSWPTRQLMRRWRSG